MKKLIFIIVFATTAIISEAQPIAICKENPHYFSYHGKPTILVGSTEHYGSVINPDFNFVKYLTTLKKTGINHTRIWLGDYVEKPGDFCLSENTSAPEPGRFLTPWVRSAVPGFPLGGNKFDLDKWNPEYFDRLQAFMKAADDNDIIVECILFFVGPNWQYLPMNNANNINSTTQINGSDYLTLDNGNILEYQEKYCLKIIHELNNYDNVIFNIANEPWFNNQEHVGFASPARDKTKEWIKTVSEWIVNEEQKLPKKHIISVDYMNEGRKISMEEMRKYWSNIAVFNHHYDKDAESARLNYDLNKVMSFNETGLMPPSTPQYRIQGWKYLMSGGALYDNLDFTFETGAEDGSGGIEFVCNSYNGCNDKKVKFEMAALLRFMNSIDFVNMQPDDNLVTCAWGDQNFCSLENRGKEYAIYIYGGSNSGAFGIAVVPGKYKMLWINPSDAKLIKQEERKTATDGSIWIDTYPSYEEDLALVLQAVN